MNLWRAFTTFLSLSALIIGGGTLFLLIQDRPEQIQTISSFEDCVAAGNPVMESYPRQCRHGEAHFVENVELPVIDEVEEGESAIESAVQAIKEVVSEAVEPIQEIIQEEILTSGPLEMHSESLNGDLTVAGTLEWSNINRASEGLPPLTLNSLLNAAAEVKMLDMFDREYFEHVAPTGEDAAVLADNQGYDYLLVGENLALGNFYDDEDLVTAWMNSPGHRANIMHESYQEIGIAVGLGQYEGEEVWIAVQIFGTPATLCEEPSQVLGDQLTTGESSLDVLQLEIEAAQAELEETQPRSVGHRTYNEMVDAYNALVNQYNSELATHKALIAQYNALINEFNTCIEQYVGS